MLATGSGPGWEVHKTRSTSLGWAVLTSGALLAVLGSLTGQRWLFFMCALLIGLRIAAWLTTPKQLLSARLCFVAPTRCSVGEKPRHTFHVHNPGPGWTPECVLQVASVGFERFSAQLPPIPPGGQAEATVERVAVGRGEADRHDVALTWSDWMGMRRLCAHVTAQKVLIVHPRVVSRTMPKLPGGDGELVGTRIDRTGSQAYAVREWRSGDPARHIHWRSTARRGQLVVVEHAVPVGEALTFLVIGDGRVRASEDQVTTLASLAVAAKRAGHVVTLGARQAGLHPLSGGTSVDILDWCARLDVPTLPSPELVGELFQGFGTDGQVLFATSGDIPGDWWTQVKGLSALHGVPCSLIDDVSGVAAPSQPKRR